MSTRPYQEGGALYALGLIHANKGGQGDQDILKYLRDHLQAAAANQNETASEVIQHGACLGLGLAAMGTSNAEIFEQLKNVLYSDRAVAGEAAAVSMGLLALGSASSNVLNQMIRYAHQTKHEKIIRGLGLAMALTMFGQEQGADTLISQLVSDNDPILRCSAMWTTAAAYAGTSSNAAIRRLLHISVSDVDNDVRRTAVMCLGFVMLRTPELVPRLVALLAESYNPHVRYGACMAIGIACAGKPTKEALDLLCSMLDDKVSFVKQGALLSLALVLTQEHEARTPRVKMLREKIMSIVGDKHQSVVSKFGATLAAGILDAGGRNMCVNMISGAGFLRQGAVVGMIVWLHHWYWYPYLQFLSLALKPTAVIGVNKDMKIPEKFRMTCLCRPSLFAYPEMLKEDKEEKKERVKAAVLSTTAKAKAKKVMRDQKSEEGGDVEMSTDDAAAAGTGASASTEGDSKSDDASDAEAGSKKEGDDAAAAAAKTKKPEPKFFTLQNPSRVTYAQQRYLKYDEGNRYRPVHSKTKRNLGVVVLTDTTPGEADDELQDIEEPPKHGDVSDEPAPPEPFVWTPPAPADSEK